MVGAQAGVMTCADERISRIEENYRDFWTERRLCTLTTLRPDGLPHVVPVGVTVDFDTMTARVITSRSSRKARNVRAGGADGAPVAVPGGRPALGDPARGVEPLQASEGSPTATWFAAFR